MKINILFSGFSVLFVCKHVRTWVLLVSKKSLQLILRCEKDKDHAEKQAHASVSCSCNMSIIASIAIIIMQ